MGYVGQAPPAGGVTSSDINDGTITNDDIASDAAISMSKTALVDGTGVTLSTDTLSVDASQTQITAVGTIGTGTWEATDVGVEYGGTGVSTLTDGGVLVGNGTGAIQATSAGTSGQVLTSNGTGVDPTFQDAAGGGITDATTFRLSADTAATGDLTSNWEVDDSASGYATLGSAVTEASGIFTFPSTGIWLVIYTCAINNVGYNGDLGSSQILTTNNNSTYIQRTYIEHKSASSGDDYHQITHTILFDVDSTANDKVKFRATRTNSTTANAAGHTSQHETHVQFIRLADT